LGLQGVLSSQGRYEEMAALLADELVGGETAVRFLYVLDALAGAPTQEQARALDALAAETWGPSYESVGLLTAHILAVWNAYEGDVTTLSALTSRLGALEQQNPDLRTSLLASAARGHEALARGDTLRAIEVFRGLTPISPYTALWNGLWEPLAAERILLADLLLARGEAEEAYRVAAVFDHPEPAIFVSFLPRSLEIRVRAAESLRGPDWSRRAEEARTRLAALGREEVLARLTNGGSR
jgi:hypothetical protein